jgi:hypothetical protein
MGPFDFGAICMSKNALPAPGYHGSAGVEVLDYPPAVL